MLNSELGWGGGEGEDGESLKAGSGPPHSIPPQPIFHQSQGDGMNKAKTEEIWITDVFTFQSQVKFLILDIQCAVN